MGIQNFLNGLDKLTFFKHNDKTLHTAEGFQINYSLELCTAAIPNYPITFTFRVWKGSILVNTWDCSSDDDNKIATNWWFKKCRDISYIDYEEKYAEEILAREQFENLTK
jgi:hypothetical protein